MSYILSKKMLAAAYPQHKSTFSNPFAKATVISGEDFRAVSTQHRLHLKGYDYQDCVFGKIDLSNRNLKGVDLSTCTAQHLTLTGAKIDQRTRLPFSLKGADLRGADLSKLRQDGLDFTDAIVDGETKFPPVMRRWTFVNVDLSRHTTHSDGRTTYIPLRGLTFEECVLNDANFGGLDHCTLRECQVKGSRFFALDHCTLENLHGEILTQVANEGYTHIYTRYMRQCHIANVDISFADHAHFTDCRFSRLDWFSPHHRNNYRTLILSNFVYNRCGFKDRPANPALQAGKGSEHTSLSDATDCIFEDVSLQNAARFPTSFYNTDLSGISINSDGIVHIDARDHANWIHRPSLHYSGVIVNEHTVLPTHSPNLEFSHCDPTVLFQQRTAKHIEGLLEFRDCHFHARICYPAIHANTLVFDNCNLEQVFDPATAPFSVNPTLCLRNCDLTAYSTFAYTTASLDASILDDCTVLETAEAVYPWPDLQGNAYDVSTIFDRFFNQNSILEKIDRARMPLKFKQDLVNGALLFFLKYYDTLGTYEAELRNVLVQNIRRFLRLNSNFASLPAAGEFYARTLRHLDFIELLPITSHEANRLVPHLLKEIRNMLSSGRVETPQSKLEWYVQHQYRIQLILAFSDYDDTQEPTASPEPGAPDLTQTIHLIKGHIISWMQEAGALPRDLGILDEDVHSDHLLLNENYGNTRVAVPDMVLLLSRDYCQDLLFRTGALASRQKRTEWMNFMLFYDGEIREDGRRELSPLLRAFPILRVAFNQDTAGRALLNILPLFQFKRDDFDLTSNLQAALETSHFSGDKSHAILDQFTTCLAHHVFVLQADTQHSEAGSRADAAGAAESESALEFTAAESATDVDCAPAMPIRTLSVDDRKQILLTGNKHLRMTPVFMAALFQELGLTEEDTIEIKAFALLCFGCIAFRLSSEHSYGDPLDSPYCFRNIALAFLHSARDLCPTILPVDQFDSLVRKALREINPLTGQEEFDCTDILSKTLKATLLGQSLTSAHAESGLLFQSLWPPAWNT